MTWAAMLRGGDGGAGQVSQAAPSASKTHMGTTKASVTVESKPMDMTPGSQQAQPQRMPRYFKLTV